MANHEINTTINIATNVTNPTGGGGVGGASSQLTKIVSAVRALQNAKNLKELPEIFKNATTSSTAFAKSLDGVNAQLALMVKHIDAIKKQGGVQVGIVQTVSGGPTVGGGAPAGAVTAAAAAAAAAPAKAAGGGGGKPRGPRKPRQLTQAEQNAKDQLEAARIQKIQAKANLASVDAAAINQRAAKIAAEKAKTPAQKEAEAAQKRTEKRDRRQRERQVENALSQDMLDANALRRNARVEQETKLRRDIRMKSNLEYLEATKAKSLELGDAKQKKKLQYLRETADVREEISAGRQAKRDAERTAREEEQKRERRIESIKRFAKEGVRRTGAVALGGLTGAQGVISALGAAGSQIPVIGGLSETVAGLLSQAYQAGGRGIDLREASNEIFMLQQRQTMFGRGRPSASGGGAARKALSKEERLALDTRLLEAFLAPREKFNNLREPIPSEEEEARRRAEDRLLKGDKSGMPAGRIAAQFGMSAIDYLQLMAQYGRAVPGGLGKDSTAANTQFPVALALSQTTGAGLDVISQLALGIRRGGLGGRSVASVQDLNAGLRLNQTVMPLFAQAISDGMNESEAVEILQQLTQQVTRGAQRGIGTDISSGYLTLGARLAQKGGLSAASAYGAVTSIGKRAQEVGYGARSPYDLLFLKYFGGLDLKKPGSEAYYDSLTQAMGTVGNKDDLTTATINMIKTEMRKSGGRKGRGRVSDMLRAIAGIDLMPHEVLKVYEAIEGGTFGGGLGRPQQIPDALDLVRRRVSDAAVARSELETRKDMAGLDLVPTFQKLDEINAGMLENVKLLEVALKKLATIPEYIERAIRGSSSARPN